MVAHNILAQRETRFAPIEVTDAKLDGSFHGYASLFSKVDQANDAVMKGAFSTCLKKKDVSSVRMLFQHNPDEPIGVWQEIREDQKGLFVRGKIARGVKRGQEVLELMRAGALDGLSIGFKTNRARKDARTGVRWILAADLWEISVVTFPQLDGARILSVKADGDMNYKPTKREFERWLTRDAGLSRRDARHLIAKGYDAIADRQDAVCTEDNDLAGIIRKVASNISNRSMQ